MTFFQLINQNSYVVIALFLFAIVSLVLGRVRRKNIRLAAIAVAALGFVALYFVLRVGVSEIQTTSQFDEILASRQPVVLEIYSNY